MRDPADAKVDAAARSFAAARRKLQEPSSPNKGLKETKKRGEEVVAAAPGNRLKKSGRTDLWGIRCKPEVKEKCQAIAREVGKDYSEWAEELFEAAIAAHPAKKANGAVVA
jgi:hypothetical protein